MVQTAEKRQVGRGASRLNKIKDLEMANGIINMKLSEEFFMNARAVALAKNPQLKTNPEIMNFILADYFSLHQINVKVEIRKSA